MGCGYGRELRAGEEMRDEICANLGCLFMAIVGVSLGRERMKEIKRVSQGVLGLPRRSGELTGATCVGEVEERTGFEARRKGDEWRATEGPPTVAMIRRERV